MSTTANDETDRRLTATVGLVVVMAACAVGWSIWEITTTNAWKALPWAPATFMVISLVLAGRLVVRVRIKASRQAVGMLDAVVLVGVMLLPGGWLILITAVAVTAGWLSKRIAAIKTFFNIGKEICVVGAAVFAASLAGLHGPVTATLDRLPAMAITAGAIAIADEILALPVLALATRTPLTRLFRTNLDVRLGGTAARLTLATVSLFWLSRNPAMVALVPITMIGLQLLSANRLRERAEREAWQKLAQATDEFNAVDLDAVVTSAVGRAAELFSADHIDVVLAAPGLPDRVIRGDANGVHYDGTAADAPSTDEHHIQTKLQSHDGSSDVGILRLGFHGSVKLTEREEYTLRTFAAALCTAVRNAAAYTEAQRLAEHNAHAATHDPLTNLANRRHLYDVGNARLRDRPRGQIGLLLIDLNHFKEINDTLGHDAGDQVLTEISRRLVEQAEPGDLVARLGGDEFAVLLHGVTAPALALPRARGVLRALGTPVDVDGMRIQVEASAGVALAAPRGGVEELLRRADVAMYQAKREGQQLCVYARARDTADIARLALSAELPRAVAEHEFTVNFQPIVDLGSGMVISTEALARWHHPDQGDLHPRSFLDSVERSGLLPAFSEAVLDQALRAAATWRADGFDLPVAVNISPRSLLDPGLPAMIQRRLELATVAPDGLIIELTESLTLSQLDVVDEVLCALRDAGVRLALDDFGTGYSSLATLARVPVHEIKIDRTFVSAMDGSAESAVIRSTIELGRSLDMLVVAEGVESEEQRGRLWELGCLAGQGHLFARPMPVSRLLATLRRGYDGRPGALAPQLHANGAVIRLPARRQATRRRGELG